MKKPFIILLVLASLVLGPVNVASAGEPAQRFPAPDVNVDVINPCTNTPVTVTWTDLMLVLRDGQDANGGTHSIFTLEGTIVDPTGYSGQFLYTSHENGNLPDDFATTFHFTVIGKNIDTKETIVLHQTTHMNFQDGIPTIMFTIYDEECRGKPN